MGAQKDINRIRELIIGSDFKKFEKRFDAIEIQLKQIEDKQNTLAQKIKKQRKDLTKDVDEINTQIQSSTQKSSEQLKTFKSELIMHLESKLNTINKVSISKKQLASMFATLSLELEDEVDTKKHAK